MIDDLLEQFLIEGRELVQRATDDLLALERDGDAAGHLDSAFRAVHTLKGSVALFDFAPMGGMLHAAEDLLGAIRGRRIAADRTRLATLLDCIGHSDDWLGEIARSGTLPSSAAADGERLAARLRALSAARPAPGGAAAPPTPAGRQEAAPARQAAAAAAPAEAASRPLRVDAAHVDALLDRVGELTVASNGLADRLGAAARNGDPATLQGLLASQAEIARLVEAVHGAVMRVRMTPLTRIVRRLPRLLRDTADRLGKEVSLDIAGDAVEADKTVVDGLFEPLLHILRNAVDHGIEAADLRAARGKPAAGRIALMVRREADRIVLEIADDGGGIDCAKVRATALTRGLLSEAALRRMDDAAIADLIFAPGLSTAATISEVSGRGIGMDVVRTTVEGLGGQVGITSRPGIGSVIRLSLPQTVLVRRIMVVRAGEDRFGIPLETIAETARLPRAAIRPIGPGEAFVLRGRTLPLVRLTRLLDLADRAPAAAEARVLVVQCNEQPVGIEVDGFAEPVDVVLRPMAGLLAAMSGLLGTALLGNGRVLMVLDLPELVG